MKIRPLEDGDAGPAFEATRESIAEVHPWLSWCHRDYSLKDAEEWVALQLDLWEKRTELQFAIVDDDGTYLGGCGLNQLDPIHRFANLGYWVRTSATGRGVATFAVRELVEYAERETELVRLEVVVAVGNAPSLRVAEKSGALREGVLRKRLCLHGTVHDAVMYSFTFDRDAAKERRP